MGYFGVFKHFMHQNSEMQEKKHYISYNELKYVKNWLLWCFPAFYALKLRNAGKTLYFSKSLCIYKSFYIVMLESDKINKNKPI
ncbi:hypothetical protein E2C01_071526 [Portunus trituberculatus]|uniref:Uncharacterized protein n=1 Tax=Portunus trituberculatus TaxID=210409 RepID=A0A5B7HVK1_PORTR|nr:hypothetical protein [Portunus trituberculatus]